MNYDRDQNTAVIDQTAGPSWLGDHNWLFVHLWMRSYWYLT